MWDGMSQFISGEQFATCAFSLKTTQKFWSELRQRITDLWLCNQLVIVIPLLVRLYVKIIQELWRVDYLTYRWTSMA